MPSLALHRRSLDLPSGLYLDIEGAAPDLLRGGGLRLTRSHLGLALQLHEIASLQKRSLSCRTTQALRGSEPIMSRTEVPSKSV